MKQELRGKKVTLVWTQMKIVWQMLLLSLDIIPKGKKQFSNFGWNLSGGLSSGHGKFP